MKLSVVISAFNEEKKIKKCLDSIKWADEIILIDNSSTDKTVQIAKQYTKKIFEKPNNLMLNVNKNFGFSKASGDWILSLDADEIISPELTAEIKKTIQTSDNSVVACWIPRKNIIFNKWIEHTGWYPDHQLRLFRKGKGKFAEKHVHEMLSVDGNTSYLLSPMIHSNYESISQFIIKMCTIYAPNEAEDIIRKGYTFSWKDAINFPAKEFLSRFFAREGYKDGLHGLVLSLLMSFYHLVVFINVWEHYKFEEHNSSQFLTQTHEEFKSVSKDLKFWIYYEKQKNIHNPVKKLVSKISHKFHN